MIKTLTFEQIKFLKESGRTVKIQDTTGFTEVSEVFTKTLPGKLIYFSDGTSIKCADSHFLLITKNNNKMYKNANELKPGDECTDKYGSASKSIVEIKNVPEQKWVDFSVSNEFETYVQNDIIHHNSGKSLILSLIMQYLNKIQKNTLLIVPNVLLINQMKQDMIDYFGDTAFTQKIRLIGGDNRLTLQEKHDVMDADTIVISTWQSLYKNPELTEYADAIIIDEAHGAAGESIESLMSSAINSVWRIGLTGTIPRNYIDKVSILSVLGKSKIYINPQGLIDRGLATPVFIRPVFINYNKEDREIVKNLKQYQKEVQFIADHIERNQKVGSIIHKLSTTGNTLVLADKIDHIKGLLITALEMKSGIKNITLLNKITPKFIKEAFKEGYKLAYNGEVSEKDFNKIVKTVTEMGFSITREDVITLSDYSVYLIYGGIDGDQREYIRKIIAEESNAILVATYATMSTGANIPKLHYIVLGSSTKSFVRLNQSVGRGMRLHESKDKMVIIDIVDDLQYKGNRRNSAVKKNYVYKHFLERLEQYRENGYPIKETDIYLEGSENLDNT